MRSRRSRLGAALLLGALTATTAVAMGPVPTLAGSDTFRVRFSGDKGDVDIGDGVCDTTVTDATTKCSLRAAIQEANATAAQDRITFRIQGGSSAIKTIRPTSPLPTITQPLVIDGYTQAGATPNSAANGTNAVLRVELDGRFITAAGLSATARIEVRGLAIYFFGRGIQLSAGSDGSRIMGNFIGTDATGTQDRGNDSSGILVNSEDVLIGRIVRGDRNLISGNTTSGINLGIAARRAVIQGNLIGTRKNGRGSGLGNEGDGIFITGSRGHLIGGEFSGQRNAIAWNGGDGVALIRVDLGGDALVPTGNRILSNSIFRNAGLGIDLADDGVTPNDAVPDPDRGPNGLQNFPRIESAAGVAGGTVIRGRLVSRRDAEFLVQLFVSPAGDPEGRTLLTSFSVNTGGDGRVSFNRTVGELPVGALVTGTATDVARTQTSEFGTPRSVTP